MPARPPSLGYLPGLDGVRAVAIIAVVAFHASGLRLGGLGAAGVTVFFVLSGFLITRVLLAERAATGTVSLRRFYTRRALRLLPALIAMVAITTALRWANGDERALLEGARAVSYVGDWWTVFSDGMGPLGATWSLAVEEQFYLVWPPLLIGLLAAGGVRSVTIGAGILLTAAVAVNSLFPWSSEARYLFAHLGLFQASSLLLGVVLALISLPRMGGTWVLTAAALVVLTVASAQPPTELWHRYADHAFAVAGVVLILVGIRGGVLALWPLPYIGRVSYSWYLWHAPVLYLVGDRTPMILGVALSFAVAMVSFHLLEQPIRQRGSQLRWTDRPSVRRGGHAPALLRIGSRAGAIAAAPSAVTIELASDPDTREIVGIDPTPVGAIVEPVGNWLVQRKEHVVDPVAFEQSRWV